ncbi:nitrate ABC transporter substrate-binding protein [uncultured Bosea sp.]|uniref:nitrate ABC transporter substrate-binding protein n=1 Tax=uncultured Bosea sp. TaxID=211457 RepID=UPI00263B8689|nr:nitrate ABC transporter substrate-binding protein [uncultured Bosea sp.]
MKVEVRLALRDWDYVTPLVLGDVADKRIALKVDRVGTLPEDLATDPDYDACEVSFSRYTTGRSRGENGIFGVPNFVMRGFRHRCIITSRASRLTKLEELKGCRIGVTGWQDSGNTWTRAALAPAGVGIEDVRWYAGRLSAAHPITDRLGPYARPGRIEAMPGEKPMLDALLDGELDAIFTPFMPPGFYAPDSPFRHLLTDLPGAELAYFRAVGYVPGIHILGFKADFARRHPWLPQALSDLLDESQRVWLEKRRKYADTTPWIIDELGRCGRDLPESWNASGLEANRRMIAGFLDEIRNQGLARTDLTPDTLFPPLDHLADAA